MLKCYAHVLKMIWFGELTHSLRIWKGVENDVLCLHLNTSGAPGRKEIEN